MALGSTQPFRPAGTATLAAGTSSQAVTLPGSGEAVLIYNGAAAVAFVAFGPAGVTATPAGVPVPPGARMLIHCGGGFVTSAAALLASGSGNVYFTRGDGTVY